MKSRVVVAALVGLLSSGLLYYVWCSWNWKQQASDSQPSSTSTSALPGTVTTPSTPVSSGIPASRFTAAGTVSVDARVGNAYVLASTGSTTHIALTATTGDSVTRSMRVPANVVLVIDRSGSMNGSRIQQAKAAAEYVLDSLLDGDQIAIITYDSISRVDIPSTALNGASRNVVRQAIRSMGTGGSTCVQCGLESAEAELSKAYGEGVGRVILFSDGQANVGERDPIQLGKIAKRIEGSGALVSTIGVGLDYNETTMSQIAIAGNGNHYFVEDDSMLAKTLQSEVTSLQQLVARRVMVSFELADGVRFVKGYDRDFQVSGNRIVVSLGDMPASSERTMLFEVALPSWSTGRHPLSELSVSYDDLSAGQPWAVEGSLALAATPNMARVEEGLDSDVAARVEAAALALALATANEQIRSGKLEDAQQTMNIQYERSYQANESLGSAKLKHQLDAFDSANKDLAKPATKSAEGKKRRAKSNAQLGRSLAF